MGYYSDLHWRKRSSEQAQKLFDVFQLDNCIDASAGESEDKAKNSFGVPAQCVFEINLLTIYMFVSVLHCLGPTGISNQPEMLR